MQKNSNFILFNHNEKATNNTQQCNNKNFIGLRKYGGRKTVYRIYHGNLKNKKKMLPTHQ